MRYEGKRPSRKDKQVDVYCFCFGMEEIDALKKILADFKHRCPLILETQIIRARVGTMLGEFKRFEIYKRLSKEDELESNPKLSK